MLAYLSNALAKQEGGLSYERDAITVSVALEAAEGFMDGLDVEEMERAVTEGFSREDVLGAFGERRTRRVVPNPRMRDTLSRYGEGRALTK